MIESLGQGTLLCGCRNARLEAADTAQGYRQYLVMNLVLPSPGNFANSFCLSAIAIDVDSFSLFRADRLRGTVLVEVSGQESSLGGQSRPLVRILVPCS